RGLLQSRKCLPRSWLRRPRSARAPRHDRLAWKEQAAALIRLRARLEERTIRALAARLRIGGPGGIGDVVKGLGGRIGRGHQRLIGAGQLEWRAGNLQGGNSYPGVGEEAAAGLLQETHASARL